MRKNKYQLPLKGSDEEAIPRHFGHVQPSPEMAGHRA